MKKVLSIVALVCITTALHAQYSYEIVNSQQVRKDLGPIAADNNGNTIITGTFTSTLTLGSFTLNNNNGYDQAFVAKRLADGSFAWVKMLTPLSIQGSTSIADINGVSTDAAGNVYLTGNFFGKISFANGITLTSTKNGPTYTRDLFAEKISSDGTVIWARSAGTANDGCNAGESARSVTTDVAGNVYITGQVVYKVFKNTTICNEIPGGPSCSNATTKSITCPIVIKYTASGTKVWERKYGNDGALAGTSCWYNHPEGTDIRTDGINVYVAGYFYGTVNFGAGSLSTGSETTSNVFLIKLDGNGNTVWARSVTGGGNNTFGVGDGLFVDGNDIYISGIYSGSISSGACSLPVHSPSTFLFKYSSAGICQWSMTPGGISYGIVKLANGNLAMLRRGRFYSIRQLSPLDGSVIDSTVVPLEDTATGSVGGYPSITNLPDGFIFSQMVTGSFHFGELTITSSVPLAGGWPDMTLIKYTNPEPSAPRHPGNIISEASSSKILVYPNPVSNALTIRNANNHILGDLAVYDVSGKIIYKNFIGNTETTIDVKRFPAGFYYIRSAQLQATIKFIKQ